MTAAILIVLAALPAPGSSSRSGAKPPQQAPGASLQPRSTVAQRFEESEAWRQIYQQLPDLPLENQYVSRETGKVSEDNTLVGRLIRYHIYVKGRPPNYRLDWKLTLADYLGANERVVPETYPSGTAFRTNPVVGDTTAINNLNRAQRDALVQALVNVFAPATNSDTTPEPSPVASPSPQIPPSPPPPPAFPREPQPGDAHLLQP
jgi:hypothetical protein